jgi:hypothetical protein
MIQFIRRVIGALLGRLRPFGPGPPQDPYAAVREPRRHNPTGRGSAVALAEPEPRKGVEAVGASRTRANHADVYDVSG